MPWLSESNSSPPTEDHQLSTRRSLGAASTVAFRELRYEVSPPSGCSTGDRALITYDIHEVGMMSYIARLSIVENGIYQEDSEILVVHFIGTERDSREEPHRPRARDVLAAFWVHQMGRSLRRLRVIHFRTIVEPTTRDVVRDYICPLLDVAYDQLRDTPWEDITLYATSLDKSLHRAWNLLCERSKLVRCAKGVLQESETMTRLEGEERLDIVQVDIKQAYDKYGDRSNFDLMIYFGNHDVLKALV
ncbi:hypothetical protein M406DRAFT_66176 [Cryphonectria parasitica EP155]|uniref:Uncharacterized protein n=1 Tax=Cryphonectria parasitica (strain ATCC 38755 / EP155) TaxID=660469 RepID=A0A9P4YAZ4_CRYP1|nr:uncharacterized protein M406DRAFT_66176 [Cryphonectria parasitica EP155]KAF3769706.1 hypothetical protein M406DRAFT_66176 [Cryphonectria parasitica EP155]